MGKSLSIGQAAAVTGIKIPTIRYYEQIGLLPAPDRTAANRRYFHHADLDRLRFIRHARTLGFDINAIRALLHLQDEPGQSCAVADRIARERLLDVQQRLASLEALKVELERMVEGCAQGHVADCRVIQVLGDHSLCRFHDGGQSDGPSGAAS